MYFHTYVIDKVRSIENINAQFDDFIILKVISEHYGVSFPSSRQLLANLNGVLINTHNVLDYPR